MKRLKSRYVLGSLAAATALLLGGATAARAQYGTGGTTTTTSTSTTSTSTTSTSTTSTSTTSTTIGASPGTTIATGSGTQQQVGVSSHFLTPGEPFTVDIPTNLPFSQGQASSNAAGVGPCAPSSPVGIYMLLLQNGQSPVSLATATSNSSGGLDPIKVTVPSTAKQGTYVAFAQCTSSAGVLVILTSPLVLVTSTGAHSATAPRTFTASSTYGTPAQRLALNHAVQAQINRSASASGNATPNGGLDLIAPKFVLPGKGGTTSDALSYGLTAAVLALVAAGLVVLRRRRSLPAA